MKTSLKGFYNMNEPINEEPKLVYVSQPYVNLNYPDALLYAFLVVVPTPTQIRHYLQ